MANEVSKDIKAQPEKLPKPTYWPFFLALGVVFMFWGILTSWIISGIGLILFSVALTGWIKELYKELPKQNDHGL
ncbi:MULTISPECIES: cytochrome c oxidase subunit 4 [unclassified Leeuwenhoekiella]|uniref:aa3-type cytochrome oxidase subunit IV n=1 Tax=unclassified Leeuwenhoekiella TaxID=2615029 RepID=UPI000C3C54BA|nr:MULTISPECIES: cytochrome c oxidase subunit 4 [unclassified Leeuwenhoekiella]MAW95456.1 hypothetical protein [Leeuwenhoekiella sp.]MBA80843.1 hypothetical protein [Leeuwenhoekiella sp.]|tara:strand:- start:11303 stop:11527 length:225 start_codon:yes stop_codon:yes gene_type:complete